MSFEPSEGIMNPKEETEEVDVMSILPFEYE